MNDETKEPGLLPCPFCGGTDTAIEPLGMVWRGVKGYSNPQWYRLQHHGRLSAEDEFLRCHVEFRARTKEQAATLWNTRADPDIIPRAREDA